MVKVIRIYADMTFTEKNVKSREDKLIITKEYTPNFKIGTSVFRERTKPFLLRILTPWKRPRNLLVLVDGAKEAVSLDLKDHEKPAYAFNFGTLQDTIAFLKKVTYKSIADRKPISNNQFLVLALLMGAILMFQFMVMKGIKF